MSNGYSLDGVIFDLDGVVTDSATIHAVAWKGLFDSYLRSRAMRVGEQFKPFRLKADYHEFVDGKPRYDGVRAFLASRGIVLPEGAVNDAEHLETICALGNRKDKIFTAAVKREGVRLFPHAVRLLRDLHDAGIKTGVATSSKNCGLLLATAKMSDVFEAKVDGVDSLRLGLRGKPSPDIFLRCAMLLGVSPRRCAVIEDAISGVQAGVQGGFGLIVGVAGAGRAHDLRAHGADIALASLRGVTVGKLCEWARVKDQ